MATTFDKSRQNPYTGQLSVKIVIDEREVGILDSKDILDCYMVEDIYSFCITGKIVFYDIYGLLEYGPLTGNEMISFVYGTEEEREITFHIWRIKTIIQTSPNHPASENMLEIYFVDTAFYGMTVPKYSRSFSIGETHSNVVRFMLESMIGWNGDDIALEATNESLSEPFIMPYWTVGQCINWLLRRSSGVSSGTAGYLCWNSTRKTWSANVRTLNWLFGEDNIIDDQDYIFEGGNENQQNKIWEWWIEGVDKSTMNTIRGGTWRGVVPSTNELIEENLTFATGVSQTTLLGRKTFFPDISDENSFQRISGERDNNQLKNVIYDEWVKRYSLQNAINVIVEGNEKRYAGHQIQIRWPSANQKDQLWQKQLEGKYLIKSITHNFVGANTSNLNYMQRLVLLKNAFQDSDSTQLLNASKKNSGAGKKQTFVRTS